jgi:flavin reductase (DIM6/NTAB) family NADH-FMN oxidoreductase RutF
METLKQENLRFLFSNPKRSKHMNDKRSREEIGITEIKVNPFTQLSESWMLLTAGDFEKDEFNTMTVAWGSFGTMWFKPFVMVVVRPHRYTFEFMEKYDTFTLSGFPSEYHTALEYCGSHSGRECDKVSEAGITPQKSANIAAPAFKEAEIVFECRKNYFGDFETQNFLDPKIESYYPKKDYHKIYFGEVIAIYGTEKYRTGK